jgi:outer membrane protein
MKQLTFALIAVVVALPARVSAADGKRELTLDEALQSARAHHPHLQAAHAQTEASAARVEEAKAPLLPQVSGTGLYQRSGKNTSSTTVTSTGAAVPTVGSSSGNLYSFGATANELIYDFGQTTGKWNASKATLRAQEQNERNFAVQVAFILRQAYYNAAAARALVKVAEENLRNQEAHLRQIQGFVEAGTRPEIDLAQARTDRANAKVQLINAQVAYDTDKALLNQAMGVEQGTDYDVAEPATQPIAGEDGGIDALLPTALGARPDLLALGRQIEAQELTTSALKGGYAPALGASAGVSESGPALDDLRWAWNLRLTLNWQIFSGFGTQQQIAEARATTAALRAQYDLQRQQVRADVEQARFGVRSSKAAIDAAHEAAENARVRLTLAEGRYQAGVGNVIELGDAQVALTTAAGQEVQATYNLANARARLLQALGQP